VDGVAAAVAPRKWRKGDAAIVEAFPAVDGAASRIQGIVDRSKEALKGTNATVSGLRPSIATSSTPSTATSRTCWRSCCD
jgi:hypothetical protein